MDAANLLKPALARGELRTIGATTWAEYKKYFEKDPALTRRFQTIQVAEPSEENACAMLRALAERLEKHHQVNILDEAIVAAVKLSKRYILARQLPDKAIGVLDTACARVSVSLNALPIRLTALTQKIMSLDIEKQYLFKQEGLGYALNQKQVEKMSRKLHISKQKNKISKKNMIKKKLLLIN